MPNYDLGLGLIQGLQQGMNAYLAADERRKDREQSKADRDAARAFQDKQLSAGLAEHGRTDNGDGTYGFDPAWEEQQIRLMKAKEASDPMANLAKSLSPGQKMVDTSFAKDYNDYQMGGGKATVDKNLGLLQGAADTLADKKDLTGNWTQRTPFFNSDAIQSFINPDSLKVRDDIRGAVQASLRQTLGSQFTEREGEAIFNRSFDPKLSPQENIRRIQNVLGELKQNANAKEQAGQYYEGHGTLKGFSPASQGLLKAQAPANDANKGLLNPLAPGQAGAGGMQKVRVSNGRETLMIDPSDLQDAMKDGYKQVP